MTERKWLACAEPERMLKFILGKASERKLRLFACACCRPLVELDDPLHCSLDLCEEIAEGDIGPELDEFWGEWLGMLLEGGDAISWAFHEALSPDLPKKDHLLDFATWTAGLDGDEEGGAARQADLLREIFNPFRPAVLDPSCLTPTVRDLALTAYTERSLPSGTLDPARLSILADALEESGCADEAILGHLRSPGPHVRGCWAVDLALGRS
jgi:hypothetical protein